VMVGVNEPDLSEVTPGIHRLEAEKILGERLWHVGVADGLSYNIYQYEVGQPARPIFGAVSYVMTFLSLGVMERVMSDGLNFGPVKQVAVGYDGKDRVVSVSRSWSIESTIVGPCRRQRYLLPTDSGVPDATRPGSATGFYASLPSSLKGSARVKATVNGQKLQRKNVMLPPGRHEVSYGGRVAIVDLLPGRHYRLERKSVMGHERSRPFLWIEDIDSREVLHCILP
jgi:hypothetical protein